MFVAHAPAGYLLTRGLRLRAPLWLGLLGSVFPDLDMLYFYLLDDRQHLHHSYWTHIPAFWVAMWLTGLALTHGRARKFRPWVHLFVASVLLHLALDTVCGGIRWLAPLSTDSFRLFRVTTRHGWWVANFLLHWTALFEVVILAASCVAVVRNLRARRSVSVPGCANRPGDYSCDKSVSVPKLLPQARQ